MPVLEEPVAVAPVQQSSRPSPAQPKDNAYDSSTWWYDLRGFGILKLSYRSSLSSQISFFEENLRQRHLEVAVGTGTLFQMVLSWRRRRGALPNEITCMDYSPQMLEGAERRFGHLPGFKILQADIAALPLPDQSVDSINIANALHCFADVPGALREIRRVLVPGGTLALNALLYPRGIRLSRHVANAINAWGIRKGILHSPFNENEVLDAMETAGFHIRRAFPEKNCLFVCARA